jgi:glutathione S-transferase
MKLYYTPTSPFVRKVLVTAHELGLIDRIETVHLRPDPLQPDATLARLNPLSKIPALVLDDGSALYDSPVICEYLDSLAGGRLLPAVGKERWRVLRMQALADGILDAGILAFYERQMRPPALHWEPWIEGQGKKAASGLDALDAELSRDGVGAVPDVGQIAAACALGWLEFRAPFGDVRAGRPALAAWYESFSARPSMQATRPHL